MSGQGEGILAWLDSAITAAEQNASRWHDTECTVHGTSLIDATVLHSATLCDCGGPESVLRRCAADRKLLNLHVGKMHSCPATDETGYLDEWTQFDHSEVCPVVEHLAEGYGWTAGQTPPTEGDQVT